jgi:hypothetical protein
VTDDARRIKKVVQSLDRLNASVVLLKFKVFKLRYSNQLVFENVIKACRNSVDCQPVVSFAPRICIIMCRNSVGCQPAVSLVPVM